MKTNIRKRIVSLLVSAAMMISSQGTAVFAADSPDPKSLGTDLRGFTDDGEKIITEEQAAEHSLLTEPEDIGRALYSAGADDDFLAKCSRNRWGYNVLLSYDNSEGLTDFYQELYDACEEFWYSDEKLTPDSANDTDDGIFAEVTYSDNGLTYQDACDVFISFVFDNPQFYFIAKHWVGYTYTTLTDKTSWICIYADSDFLTSKARSEAQTAIKSYVTRCTSGTEGLISPYRRLEIIHDNILASIDYGNGDSNRAHNIIGGIMDGICVCEGYAKIFSMLSSYAGLDTVYVIGQGYGGSSWGAHAWNMIKLDDGKYYDIDVTWDDNLSGRQYFVIGSTEFNNDHVPDPAGNRGTSNYFYELPTASETTFNTANIHNAHTFGSWQVASAANCIRTGTETRTCTVCGETETQTLSLTAHSWGDWTVTTKPTCTVDGVKTHKCTVCGKEETDVVKAEGHKYTATVVPATCTAEGYTRHTCSVCKTYYDDNKTAKTAHSWGDWTVTTKPTCTVDGVKTHKCTVCGKEETDVVKAEGHKYTSTVVAPTADERGYTLHVCKICNYTYKDNYTDPIAPTEPTDSNKVSVSVTPIQTEDGSIPLTILVYSADGTQTSKITVNSDSDFSIGMGNNASMTIVISAEGYAPRTLTLDGSEKSLDMQLCKYGDTNGDGLISMLDLALIQQYLAQWDVSMIYDATADVNSDGKVDMLDLALMQQYLAKWDVSLGV